MRIQHNIMAMNSYRNLSGNNTALSKNLEKLSSGYRINRAGDDAAGLAISEKMRAQIAGLDQAQKNAQSGINLVKTAEGALTEVHDMLNRMTTLATQAANGTYGATDRDKLQAEVDALIEEIDRIADNSNFNGTKLLDGSLAEGTEGSTTNTAFDAKTSLTSELRAGASDVNAVKGEYKVSGFGEITATGVNNGKLAAGDKLNITVNYTDADGKEQSTTVTLKVADATVTTGKMMVLDDGSENGVALSTTYATAGVITKDEMEALVIEAMTKTDAISENFKVTTDGAAGTGAANDGTLAFTSVEAGTKGAVLNSVTFSVWDKSKVGENVENTDVALSTNVTTVAKDANLAYDFGTNGKVWDPNATEDDGNVMAKLEDAIFEVNGEKFVFLKKGTTLTDEQKNQLEAAGVKHWVTASGTASATSSGITNTDLGTMAEKIEKETGLDVKVGNAASGVFTENTSNTFLMFENGKVVVEGVEGNELKLQIGADSVETIGVSIESMKAKSLGIDKLSIGDVENANKAIDTIKAAIEQVSVTRGNLGAIQNRLEHTINNLGVMEENIQDAESNIRDTDVADEMMAYTKNNILIQSAQAMLAQANQVPQGVLQLMG